MKLIHILLIATAVMALMSCSHEANGQTSLSAPSVFNHYTRTENNVPVPRLTRLWPQFGPRYGGTTVTVWGANFVNTPLLTVRISEMNPLYGQKLNLAATTTASSVTWISDSQITFKIPTTSLANAAGCMTDGQSNVPSSAAGTFNTANTGRCTFDPKDTCFNSYVNEATPSYRRCEVYVTVSNDASTFSAYPGQHDAGDYLTFVWDSREPDLSSIYELRGNTTSVVGGSTIIPVWQIVTGSTRTQFLPSENLYCMFIDAAGANAVRPSAATWLGYDITGEAKLQCTTPSFSADFTASNTASKTFKVYVTNNYFSSRFTNDASMSTILPLAGTITVYNTLGTAGGTTTTTTTIFDHPRDPNTFAAGAPDTFGLSVNADLNFIHMIARGPLQGNTELTVRGRIDSSMSAPANYVPSDRAYCMFTHAEDFGQTSLPSVPVVETTGICQTHSDCIAPYTSLVQWPGFKWTCCRGQFSALPALPTTQLPSMGSAAQVLGRCCAFSKATYAEVRTAANTISRSEYRCMTPSHPPVSTANGGRIAPGFRAAVQIALDFDITPYETTLSELARGVAPTYTRLLDTFTAYDPHMFSVWRNEPNSSPTLIDKPRLLLHERAQRFVYSDMYVSPSGHDLQGDGTAQYPLRTVQRAVDLALYNQRDGVKYQNGPAGLQFGQPASTGSLRYFNPDTIVLEPGVYRGVGNRGIRPYGKLLTLRSKNSLYLQNAPAPGLWASESIVDCENSGDGFIIESAQRYWDNDDNARESVFVQNISQRNCSSRRVYSVYNPFKLRNEPYRSPLQRYHLSFDLNNLSDPTTVGGSTQLKGAQPIQAVDPTPNRFRGGLTAPGRPCGCLYGCLSRQQGNGLGRCSNNCCPTSTGTCPSSC